MEVWINFDIKSMGPVDEKTHSISLDCYFRQFWYDRRLSYNTTGVTQAYFEFLFQFQLKFLRDIKCFFCCFSWC